MPCKVFHPGRVEFNFCRIESANFSIATKLELALPAFMDDEQAYEVYRRHRLSCAKHCEFQRLSVALLCKIFHLGRVKFNFSRIESANFSIAAKLEQALGMCSSGRPTTAPAFIVDAQVYKVYLTATS